MSEFHVVVTEIRSVQNHPNADRLDIALTTAGDYPVIVGRDEYKSGDKAVYVPVDALVPAADARWAVLVEAWRKMHKDKPLPERIRVKAKKLRGVFSMGFLTRAGEPGTVGGVVSMGPTEASVDWPLGENVQERLNITKYEPPEEFSTGGENEQNPGFLPVYTDVEGLRRYPDVLQVGEEVVVCEKIHGCNARFLHKEGRLWVGSHNNIKARSEANLWWKVAQKFNLEAKLALRPDIAVYGEVYGPVQDLKYGLSDARLVLFDAFDTKIGCYFDYDDFRHLADLLELPVVPLLYRGPWDLALKEHAEGTSVMPNTSHVREGFVVKPTKERLDPVVGRVVLKMVGEGYHLR